jgi:competence ComEA-like helix-hairpin-helix protein
MFIGKDLLALLVVAAALGYAVHAARPPPALGRAGPVAACDVPVEAAGQGVVCLTADEARRRGLTAGAKLAREATGPPARMAPDRLAAWAAPVDVNRASAEELASLDGIGPKLAQRIMAARPFTSIEDLARVRGIGRRRMARLRARLVLDE